MKSGLYASEHGVKEAVKRILRKYGVWYTSRHQAGFSSRGVPDILCCYRGRFIAIECKHAGRKPTDAQIAQLAAIERAGGIAFIVDDSTVDSVEAVLGRIE